MLINGTILFRLASRRVYSTRTTLDMRDELFSGRVFNAKGKLTKQSLQHLSHEFEQHGYIYVVNTGLIQPDQDTVPKADRNEHFFPDHMLEALGFGQQQHFSEGGQTSENWQTKHVRSCFRRMDYYPPNRYLLPNQVNQLRFPATLRMLNISIKHITSSYTLLIWPHIIIIIL